MGRWLQVDVSMHAWGCVIALHCYQDCCRPQADNKSTFRQRICLRREGCASSCDLAVSTSRQGGCCNAGMCVGEEGVVGPGATHANALGVAITKLEYQLQTHVMQGYVLMNAYHNRSHRAVCCCAAVLCRAVPCIPPSQAALRAKDAGSTRFCMGAAWRGPSQVRGY